MPISTFSVPALTPEDALIVVDTQVCFCPGGALAVPEGDKVVPVLNVWIEAAERGGAKVVASRDWHPPSHISFRESGGEWPPHCLQNTSDADFHPDLRLPPDVVILNKASTPDREEYSAFENAPLAEDLRRAGVKRVWVGGLALDYCVRDTVMDALKEGFETHLLLEATRAVEVKPGDGERAVDAMRAAGAIIEEGDCLSVAAGKTPGASASLKRGAQRGAEEGSARGEPTEASAKGKSGSRRPGGKSSGGEAAP